VKTKARNVTVGILMILVGVFVIYYNTRYFTGELQKLWPSAVFIIGTILYIYYFTTKKKKNALFILFLGTFLLFSSILLYILSFTSFSYIEALWPGFLAALGLGMLLAYLYGERKKALLAASIVLIAASILVWIFLSLKTPYSLIIGLSIIVIGAAFLTGGLIREAGPEPGGTGASGEASKQGTL